MSGKIIILKGFLCLQRMSCTSPHIACFIMRLKVKYTFSCKGGIWFSLESQKGRIIDLNTSNKTWNEELYLLYLHLYQVLIVRL